jgi:hypothetical protein
MSMNRLSRRTALVWLLGSTMAACVRPTLRSSVAPTPLPTTEFGRWNQEARAILTDALETLQTFEMYAAFRLAAAPQSDKRADVELAWDPPAAMAWNEATHVARGLHGRSEQLFRNVTSTQTDTGLWREQRDLATWTHDLQDLGDALDAYRARVDRLAPDADGTAAWDLLDRAWTRWDTSAAHWGLSRTEAIACAS